MGNIWPKILCSKFRDIRVLMVGLDAAGKTTALYQLKLGEVVTTIPTVGFNVETFKHNGVSFTTWDVSGRSGIRPLWKHYFQNTSAVIFVLDSSDRDRISECRAELWRLLEDDDLAAAMFLVLANKQDLSDAMPIQEIEEKLDIKKAIERTIYVQGTVAKTGEGLLDGYTWIQERLAERRNQTKPPVVPASKAEPYRWWWPIRNWFSN